MSAYRPISENDYLERLLAGDVNIGWAEGLGYYVEDEIALEQFWKWSDDIWRQQNLFSKTSKGHDHRAIYTTENRPHQPDGFINDYD